MVSLSINQARTIVVASQGFLPNSGNLNSIFNHVKYIQLDPLRPVRESHELVCMSRGATIKEASLLLTKNNLFKTFIYPEYTLALIPIHM